MVSNSALSEARVRKISGPLSPNHMHDRQFLAKGIVGRLITAVTQEDSDRP